ncbi:hypothetical protein [Microbacterium sp. No. 7]|uniref:hypothetical protein n=1 Tax=Microbacterium sp. No. 7 TaxID=1714373 RepID=UPI0006ECF31D|nr:hypothetical protein [Microbacterium sp. No. 7]ALJ18692.1 hypothetical protein AOA12_01680 [Microbacterium sp. No. 7]
MSNRHRTSKHTRRQRPVRDAYRTPWYLHEIGGMHVWMILVLLTVMGAVVAYATLTALV